MLPVAVSRLIAELSMLNLNLTWLTADDDIDFGLERGSLRVRVQAPVVVVRAVANRTHSYVLDA